MRQYVIILIFTLFFANQLFACDVNLISIISGERPTDAFVNNIGKLVKQVQKLGQNIFDEEKSSIALKKLMLNWVEFDTKYSQTPPEWAKKDKNWKTKIKSVADQIGVVTKLLKSENRVQAHNETLAISRKITSLIKLLPMSNKDRILLSFPTKFEILKQAFKSKDSVTFNKIIIELVAQKDKLRDALATSTVKLTDDFSSWIDSLKISSRKDAGKMGTKLQLSLQFTEEAYNKMNAKIRKKLSGADSDAK